MNTDNKYITIAKQIIHYSYPQYKDTNFTIIPPKEFSDTFEIQINPSSDTKVSISIDLKTHNRVSERHYKNNQLHGIGRKWTSEGILIMESHHNEGKFHGPFIAWYDTGAIRSSTFFTDGKMQKKNIHWYTNGDIMT